MNTLSQIKTLAVLLSTILICQFSFAGIDPSGAYGAPAEWNKWKPNWSTAFLEGIPEDGLLVKTLVHGAKDQKDFCPVNIENKTAARAVALLFGKAVAARESSFNPNTANPNAPGGTAYGLFQGNTEDANRHKCNKAQENGGGKITSDEQIKDGANSAKCLATIFENCANGSMGKKNVGKIATEKKNANGFVGCYFEVGRKGKHREDIMKKVGETCQKAAANGLESVLTREELEAARGGVKHDETNGRKAKVDSPTSI